MVAELRRHIEELVSLTDEEFEYVLSFFSLKELKKHQFLFQADEAVNQEFFVVKGLLKAYHTGTDGKDHIMQFAMEDWWISDYQAFANKTKATLNVLCLEDTVLLAISYEGKERLCAGLHKMEHFFRKKSNAGYVALQKRILSLLNGNAKERYDDFVKQYPTLMQRIPKTLVASYLGVSRETLSRLY